MDFYPIKMGTGRVLPSKNRPAAKKARGKAPALSADLKKEILERDDHTCACCGFQAQKYQQIHFKDFNPHNHDKDNLITMCIFCHQVFDLREVAEMKSGALVWLPEIEQKDLSNIARAIYVGRISQGPAADAARLAYDSLMARTEEAQNRLQTDDPYILASIMQDYLSPKQYVNAQKKLEGIRLMPLDRRIIKEADLEFNQFPQILAYWRSKNGPFGAMPPQKWINLYLEHTGQDKAA